MNVISCSLSQTNKNGSTSVYMVNMHRLNEEKCIDLVIPSLHEGAQIVNAVISDDTILVTSLMNSNRPLTKIKFKLYFAYTQWQTIEVAIKQKYITTFVLDKNAVAHLFEVTN